MESRAGGAEPPVALESVWDEVDGIRVHGRVNGRALAHDAREVVFVHGLGMSATYMEPTMRALARDRAVSALDLPGFGRSTVRGRVLSLSALADILGKWLDARGIASSILVGNSHGCQVIAELVARDSRSAARSRAAGLVLNAPTMQAGYRTALSQIRRVIADAPREPLSLVPIVVHDYLRAGPRRVLVTLRDALADRIEDDLVWVAQPVAIVCGERDPLSPPAWGERLAALAGRDVPGAAGGELHVLAGASHAMPFASADALAAVVVALEGRLG